MRFKWRDKRYIWIPTEWQKIIMAGLVGLGFTLAFIWGWFYEQSCLIVK